MSANFAYVAREGKKPSAMFHKRKNAYRVMGGNDLAVPPILNDGLGRISKSKPVNNANALIPLEELRKLEAALISLQETQSFSFWLCSSLIAYVQKGGFIPPDPALFSRLTSSLALSLVDQSKATHAMSSFCIMSRRDHFLKFAAAGVTAGQKSRLRSGAPFKPDLFDPQDLEKIASDYEGTSLTTSHMQMTAAVVKGFFAGKRKWTPPQGAPSTLAAGASQSPLSQPDNATTNFDSSRGGWKRARGNRGRGRGFQRGRGASRGSGKAGQNFGK